MTETAPRTAAPLVVLHGYSSGPESAAGLADAVDPHGDRHHLCPAGPCSVEGGRSWFDPADVGRSGVLDAAVQTVVGTLAAAREVGGDRPAVLIGWSQGGAAALAALGHPATARVAALVLAGAFVADDPRNELDPSLLVGVPVLSVHGVDDEIVPVEFADDLVSLLSSAGVTVRTWRGVAGHGLPGAALEEIARFVGEVE